MRLLRQRLPRSIKSSLDLAKLTHGKRVSTAGLVICRQQPGTAKGVVFITMEDEHGFINLILYAHVFEQFRFIANNNSILLAHGKMERDGEVLYVLVSRIEPVTQHAFPSMSRDFH